MQRLEPRRPVEVVARTVTLFDRQRAIKFLAPIQRPNADRHLQGQWSDGPVLRCQIQSAVPDPEATALIRGATCGFQAGEMRRFESQDVRRVTIGP